MSLRLKTLAAALMASALGTHPAWSEDVLRIAMTAADVPTTTGMPNNGFEGMRFVGYPIFEPLIDWDLSSADKPADLRPGLATGWKVDENDPTRWIFTLRQGVKFHDGSDFDADAVIWNLERFFDKDSPQFETAGAALTQARNPLLKSWEKIDDHTVAITTKYPASYFPYVICYTLIASPAAFEAAGSDWNAFAKAPSGTGPFQITDVEPRVSVTLSKFDGYWNEDRMAKVDKIKLFPMPEATTRLAALRSGQVDWIEVPPPDAIPGIEAAGFDVVTNTYPHIWPYLFSLVEPLALHRRAGAAGGQLRREPRRAGGAAERHRGAGLGPLSQGSSVLRQPRERLRLRPGEGEGAAGGGRLRARQPGEGEDHDLDQRVGADDADPDERVHPAERSRRWGST